MGKKVCFSVLALLVTTFAFAQKISVVSATEQKWRGGAVGSHGVNYTITLKISTLKIKFDSLYVEGSGYSLPANKNIDTAKMTYTINVGEAHSGRPDPTVQNFKDTNSANKPAVRNFTCRALIVYTYKKKKHLFEIEEMKAYPPKFYP